MPATFCPPVDAPGGNAVGGDFFLAIALARSGNPYMIGCTVTALDRE